MKYFELDKDEKKILKDFEEGSLVSVKNVQESKKTLKEQAQTTLSKTRNINIRLSQKDLQKLKAKATKEGLPYQTLASSMIHRSID